MKAKTTQVFVNKENITQQQLTSRNGSHYTSLTVSGVLRRGLSADTWLSLLGEKELNVEFLNALRTAAVELNNQNNNKV